MIISEDNLRDLPKGWLWAKWGDVSLISSGNPAPQGEENFDNGTHPFVRVQDMGNLGDRVYLKRTKDYINDKAASTLKLFPKGSVLFTKSGMSILLNQRAILADDMFVVGHIGVSFPLGEIPSEFIYYWLKTVDFKKLTHATTLPSLRLSKVEALPFPLAPFNEQKRIVAKIEELFTKLDAGVEGLKKVKAELKRYRQAVLKYAFEGKLTEQWRQEHKGELEPASKLLERIRKERTCLPKGAGKKGKKLPPLDTSELPELPDGWEWTRIGQISDSIQYGYTAKATDAVIGPKLLRITDIQKNAVNWDSVPYCRIDKDDKLKYSLNQGDLLFARTGATVGKSFLIKGRIPEAVFASYLIRIMINRVVDNEFVYKFFQSNKYWMQISKEQLGIGQPNVNGQILSRITLPIPSAFEQKQIVSEIERHFSIANEVEQAIEQGLKQSERLRQSILKKAFEGKLVPQDPADEPAEKLLERIRAEKITKQRKSKPIRSKGVKK